MSGSLPDALVRTRSTAARFTPDTAARRMGTDCAVHKHSSFVPEENHHIHPLGDGGPDVASNRVRLCANAHGLVHYCLDEIRKAGSYEALPHASKVRYSPRVRRLAKMGWDRIQEHVGSRG